MKKIIITLFCVLFGPYLIWSGVAGLIEGLRSSSWPTVPGVITISKMDARVRSRGRVSYVADIRYRYEVDGTSYIGNRVDTSEEGGASRDEALLAYPQGEQVTVHYEKKNPENAVLEVGVKDAHWWGLGFGLVLSVVGGFLAREQVKDFWSKDYETPSGF